MQQIKKTFDGLDQVESSKLRLFYIQVSIFYYLIMLLYAISFVIVGFMLLRLGIYFKDTSIVAFSLLGFIVTCLVGHISISSLFPASNKKNIDYTLYLFSSKNWRRYIFGESNAEEDELLSDLGRNSFYSFWREGKTHQEKEIAFRRFIDSLNRNSKKGTLFEFDEQGKIIPIVKIRAGAPGKTLAGFIRYCIEDCKILSKEILHHTKRGLLRDVFIIEGSEKMIFLETNRYDKTPSEYDEVYK